MVATTCPVMLGEPSTGHGPQLVMDPLQVGQNQRVDGAFRDVTNADRRDGDPELRGRDEIFRVIEAVEHAAGTLVTAANALLDTRATNRHKRKFGRNEVRIDADQHQYCEEF